MKSRVGALLKQKVLGVLYLYRDIQVSLPQSMGMRVGNLTSYLMIIYNQQVLTEDIFPIKS